MDPIRKPDKSPHRRNATGPRAEDVLRRIARDTIVLRKDANAAGVTDSKLATRVESGFLIRETPGFYRLAGGTFTGKPAMRAALRLTNSRAAGLWSAVDLHGVNGGHKADRAYVLVDWPAHYASRSWLKAHATKRPLLDHEITRRRGTPVSTMPRTIRDFAAVLAYRPWADRQLVRWTEEALMLGRLTLEQLELTARDERSRRVKARLQQLIAYERGTDGPADLRSVGEAWLRDLVVRRSLPMPLFNVPVLGVTPTTGAVDAYYPDVPLIIEFDSFNFHKTRTKHDNDRRRIRSGWSKGIPTIGITWDDFTNDLPALERDIEQFVLDPPMRPTRPEKD